MDMNMEMDMGSAVPDWLGPVAWIYIATCLVGLVVIAADIYAARRRHSTRSSELVWVTSALYLGPFAIWWYLKRGRTEPTPRLASQAPSSQVTPESSRPTIVRALLPGGSASAVAHLVAVPVVAWAGWTIAGLAMWPMILVIAALVLVTLALYELTASHSGSSGASRSQSVAAALGIAVVTVGAFDVGMVGWMLFLHYNEAMPGITEPTFWFLMQVGVVIGLATGYPAVRWLARSRAAVVPA